MLNAYDWRADRLVRLDTAVEHGPACWIDLVSPTAEEAAALETLTGIDLPSRDEMDDVEPSARLYAEDGGVFMIAAVATELETHDPLKTPVTFILKGGRLVTVRYGQPRAFPVFIAHATNKPGEKLATGESIMMGLIEAIIDRYAVGWRIERMAAIDRNILRIALYEILHRPDIPSSVAVNEAVELAKRFGDTDSPKFINGILGQVVRSMSEPVKSG